MPSKKPSTDGAKRNLERLLILGDESLGRAVYGHAALGDMSALADLAAYKRRLRAVATIAAHDPDYAVESLACVLAMTDEYELSGMVLRAHLSPKLSAIFQQKVGALTKLQSLYSIAAKRSGQRAERLRAIWEVGLCVRAKEAGWPMSDSALAKKLAARLPYPANTIRQEIPDVELDAKRWRARARAKNPVKASGEQKALKTAKKNRRLRVLRRG